MQNVGCDIITCDESADGLNIMYSYDRKKKYDNDRWNVVNFQETMVRVSLFLRTIV